MASCYGKQGLGKSEEQRTREAAVRAYLPLRTKLKDGTPVEVDTFRDSEHEAGRTLLNHELEEGRSWPFESVLSLDEFRSYFLSHMAFVVRTATTGGSQGEVLGAFYVKPNFPGRCSHICNGGFITRLDSRDRGVGTVMGLSFLRLARDLGYRASYFNLVFAVNDASIRLWTKLGFRRLATVPKAARLRGEEGLVDAHMYYYDLTTYSGEGPPPDGVVKPLMKHGQAGGAWGKAAAGLLMAVAAAAVAAWLVVVARGERRQGGGLK